MDKRSSHLYHPPGVQQYLHPTPPMPYAYSSSGAVLRMTSQQLFAGASELEITHQGAQYRLRQTALGKLILTK
jgi:hemin uptake protein HemP